MAKYNLSIIYGRFSNELTSITEIHKTSVASQYSNELSEYCLVRSLDCWSRFSRDLILYSSYATTVSMTGSIYPAGSAGVVNKEDAMNLLRNNWSRSQIMRRNWEPNWHVVDDFNKAYTLLGISNLNAINAVTAISNPIADLRAVRNFVAHRGRPSYTKYAELSQQYWTRQIQQPFHLVTVALPFSGASETLFEGWCRRLNSIAAAATQ